MNVYLRRFFRLRIRSKLLIIESAFYLLEAMFLVKFIPFRWWSRFLGEKLEGTTPIITTSSNYQSIQRVKKAILAVNFAFGDRFTCLMQAVAGKIMLNHRHIPNVLVLGVQLQRDASDQLVMKAHAWLKTDQYILLGGDIHHEYTVVTQFYSHYEPQSS